MYKEFFALVCVFASVVEVFNKPTYKSGIRQCFKQECPENTFACERLTHVSEDKKHIVAEVHCLDLKGDVIKNVTTYEDNPFGPDTEFKGYSYKGAFQVSLDNENDDTENVDKENPETSKNTETEVDDLNSR